MVDIDDVTESNYHALLKALGAKQSSRNRLNSEIEELKDAIGIIEHARRGLPTEPGMYFHPDEGWPAVLSPEGYWHDGWGNDFEDGYDLEGVRRVGWVEANV